MSAGSGRGFGLPFSNQRHRLAPAPPPEPTPPIPGSDLEAERAQAITAPDRRAILRRYFAGRGLSPAQIEAAMRDAKV